MAWNDMFWQVMFPVSIAQETVKEKVIPYFEGKWVFRLAHTNLARLVWTGQDRL